MKICVFDTETSGLPLWREPSEHPSQPHIASIAWGVFDGATTKLVQLRHHLVKPSGWEIPAEATAINGITQAMLAEYGRDPELVFGDFFDDAYSADVVVAHVASFDVRMLRIEAKRMPSRADMEAWTETVRPFCTAKASTEICKLPPTDAMLASGRRGFKTPKLQEAHEILIGKPFDGAHGALEDMLACARIYFALQQRKAAA